MPYYEKAENCPSYSINAVCPVQSCRKNITESQSIFMCSFCKILYHPTCKGLIGASKIKRASENNWFCSTECSKNATTIQQSATTPTFESICKSGSSCGFANNEFMKHIDEQFSSVKAIICDIKTSQEFICNEFESIKVNINNIVAENANLKKKCIELEHSYNKQQECITYLESTIDEFHQQERNLDLIIAGIPDKQSKPETLIHNLFKLLQCEDILEDVISSNFMGSSLTQMSSQNSTSYSDNKIIIKFKNTETKRKVFQQRKNIKPVLTAGDIGFKNNQHKHIFLKENLTPLRYKLYREAKSIQNIIKFKYLWINNGQILFREADGSRIIRIHSNADLVKLQKIGK